MTPNSGCLREPQSDMHVGLSGIIEAMVSDNERPFGAKHGTAWARNFLLFPDKGPAPRETVGGLAVEADEEARQTAKLSYR